MAGGGAAVQPDLVDKIDKALDERGARPPATASPRRTASSPPTRARLYLAKPSSCGPIVPTLDAKLVDDDGNDLAAGPDVIGQLCVRGAVVIKGYLNRPEATADAIRDGWFNTGDIARIDEDGFVFIVDRAKDMVLRGGENVYCSEVEAAIYEHDAVAEAAVFGIPDDRLGEVVGAALVLHPERIVDRRRAAQFLAERIAKYKIPSRIWFLAEHLPRNANGKFLKRELAGPTARRVTSACDHAPMTTRNEDLVLEFFATLSSGDLEALRKLIHPDGSWEVMSTCGARRRTDVGWRCGDRRVPEAGPRHVRAR